MTREECVALLYRYAEYDGIGIPNLAGCKEAMRMAADLLSQLPLSSNIDEAAVLSANGAVISRQSSIDGRVVYNLNEKCFNHEDLVRQFKAGAEWMARQGWIDDGSMPTETKQESDTLQGHREWTESNPVLAWDSMYGCCVDWTINGKWMSEQTGGYTGQVCHGIIAWRPIPEYKEKH